MDASAVPGLESLWRAGDERDRLMYSHVADSITAVAVTKLQTLNVLREADWDENLHVAFMTSICVILELFRERNGRWHRRETRTILRKRGRKQLQSASYSFLEPTRQFVYVKLECDWHNTLHPHLRRNHLGKEHDRKSTGEGQLTDPPTSVRP
jgi:hypothetical protein